MHLNDVKTLTEYFDNLKLCPKGRKFIVNAIEKRAREQQSTPFNKLFYYASLKTGFVIVCESEWEYQFLLTLEYGDSLAYLDQPPTQYIKSPNKNGKLFGRKTTGDFIAMYEGHVTVYEVKPKAKFEKLHKENPEFIEKDENGRYYNPWAEKHFLGEFGFKYELVCEDDFDVTVNGNWNLLQNYFHSAETVPDAELKALTKAIRKDVGSTIEELVEDSIPLEDIYRAIAKKQVYAPLAYRPIVDHTVFRIFSSQKALHEFQCAYESIDTEQQRDIELSTEAHEWLSATVEEQEQAAYMAKAILHHRQHRAWPDWLPDSKHSSAYRWKLKYEEAESKYGAGIIGVLSNTRKRGPRGFQGSQDVYDAMLKIKEEKWDDGNKYPFKKVYADLSLVCDALGEPTPGEDRFRKFLKEHRTEKSVAKRDGIKVAHSNAPPMEDDPFREMKKGLFLLDQTAIDHTQCNIFIRFTYMSTTIKVRPWITLLTDSLSRRVLAFYISLLRPSTANVLMTMRRYLLEYGLVMRHLGVDGGPEFDCTVFNHWLPTLKAHKIRRCTYRSKGGTKVERPNRVITDCLFHFLAGNSQQTEHVRAMDPKLDPRKNTIWTFPRLYQIVDYFFKEVYHKNSIGKHGPSPDDIWDREYQKLTSGILLPAPCQEIIEVETSVPVKGGASKIDKME